MTQAYISADKELLRQQAKDARLAMSPDDVAVKSQIITKKVLAFIDWAHVRTVHVYNSVPDWKEVDTTELVKKLGKKRGVKIVSPPIDRDNPIPAERFDVIIVPTLAFDNRNNRLGLGGGWYDKFLVTQPESLKVGLCFEAGRLPRIPTEPHDIKLDQVITEA